MDDSCAVCAESLEWVAYGACGHREVCSTCVARLRFICDDRRCCICKTESDVVFVTKALGDYTRTIGDFSVFPPNATEGRNGAYWFHEDTGAFFDDSDQYKMVKAMCRLSCSVCDNAEEQGGTEGQQGQQRRRAKFRNIEQLKGHLYHNHKLMMCSLCLEGRKIFICEQKLYTRSQLSQHTRTGDSEVDGSESDRGGFMGHPMCEFCRKPFYGDNELYTHMSTEHYTCHICQRQNPGQFEYYKDYNDLEMHFRSTHFLCEDEACLAKKFIVFPTESEMKRHNALEHGGNMSRSKRNSALQIPTSFRYRRVEEEQRRGRGRGRGRGHGIGFRPDSMENQLYTAIQASFETANGDNTNHESSAQPVPYQRDPSEIDEIVPQFESLSTTDAEMSARYRAALGQGPMNARLEESSFPPLPNAPSSSVQNPNPEAGEMASNSMAARLRRKNKGTAKVLNAGRAWNTTNSPSPHSSFTQSRPATNPGLLSLSSPASYGVRKNGTVNGSNSTQAWPATNSAPSSGSSSQTKPTPNLGLVSPQIRPAIATNAPMPSSYATLAQARPHSARVGHSASAPNLVERGSLDSSMSNFPPVSATIKTKPPASSQPVPKVVEDVQMANKSLVERIRAGLEFDENKYTEFKDISGQFRQGLIDCGIYLSYVQQFGLSHLLLELAILCPDSQKQRELIETYNASVRSENARESLLNSSNRSKVGKGFNKGKGKALDEADSNPKDVLADNIISTVKKLQANYKPSEENVEVLSKDGYRSTNRKLPDSNGKNDIQSGGGGGGGGVVGKQPPKKTSKFLRARLGDGSAAARQSESDNEEETSDPKEKSSDGLPVRGVWRNGGGQKLVSNSKR